MSRYRTLGLFLALAVAWGGAFVAISAGLEHIPPVLFAALRYDIAGGIMLVYAAIVLEDPIPRGRGQWALVAVGSTLLIAAYHALLFVGQQHTTAAAAAIIVSLMPVLTTGFVHVLVPSDGLSPIGVLGVGIGLVGVIIVIRPDPATPFATDTVANTLIFCAATAFAFGSVLTRRLEATLPIESMQAWSMLGGALLLHLLSFGLGEPINVEAWSQPEALGALAYLSVVASALGFLFYFELLERLGAVEINMVSYVVPIVTAVVGWFYLGQTIDLLTVGGFLVIAAGFGLVKRRAIRAELRR